MKRASKYNVSADHDINELTENPEEERNSAEIRAKIQELRNKARQEMMDGQALDGVSLAQYLRVKRATDKLLAMQDEKTHGTDIPQNIDPSKVAEEEKKKMASTIIKKWKNFARSANKKTEETKGSSAIKRQKNVRFKSPVEETESQSDRKRSDAENNSKNLVTTRIVFPAIMSSRPSSQHREKKPSQCYDFLPRLSVKGKSSSKVRTSPAERLQDRLPPILLTPLCLTTVTPPNSDAGSDSPTSLVSFPVSLPKDAIKENKKTLKKQVKRNEKERENVVKTGKTEKETRQNERKKRNIKVATCDMNGDTDTARLKGKSSNKIYPFSAPSSPSCSPRQPMTPFPIYLSQDSIHELGLSFGRNPTPIWRMKKEMFSAKTVLDEPGREKKRSPRLEEGDTLKTRLDTFMNEFNPHCEEELKVKTAE